jgi:hypothetical protein
MRGPKTEEAAGDWRKLLEIFVLQQTVFWVCEMNRACGVFEN